MTEILTSAAKIVFILLTITACVAFLLGILEEQNFMYLTTAAFSFYFANKGSSNPKAPHLGK